MREKKRDALDRIEKCLREYRENLVGLWDPSEAEEDLRELDRALSLLPRLRDVVDAAVKARDKARTHTVGPRPQDSGFGRIWLHLNGPLTALEGGTDAS